MAIKRNAQTEPAKTEPVPESTDKADPVPEATDKAEPAFSVAANEQAVQSEKPTEQQGDEAAKTADQILVDEQKSDKCMVVMTVPMAGIGINWAVNSEQHLAPMSAYRLVNAGNARYKSPADAELAQSAFEAEQAAIEVEQATEAKQEAAE
jgi:hypothetical protein